MEFDCEATDVCNLKASYVDYDVDLAPAHDCMMKKVQYRTSTICAIITYLLVDRALYCVEVST